MDSHTSLAVATNLWERSVPTAGDVICRRNYNMSVLVLSTFSMKTTNQEISLQVINYLELLSYFFYLNFAVLVFTVGFIALAKYIVDFFNASTLIQQSRTSQEQFEDMKHSVQRNINEVNIKATDLSRKNFCIQQSANRQGISLVHILIAGSPHADSVSFILYS